MLQSTLESCKINDVKIEIFGLGYVGFPLSVRLAYAGWNVTGIDINEQRILRLQNNILHESELFLKEQYLETRLKNKIKFSKMSESSSQKKLGIICVPTPLPNEQNSDIHVISAIKEFLRTSKKGDIIIIESSVEVGTMDTISNIIESENYKLGKDFGLAFCPERIDPNNQKWNLSNIPRIVYSSDDITFQIMEIIYHDVNNSNLFRVSSPKTAEVVKSFENTFRLVNISLVNELAILCDKLGINVSEVIEAASTKPFGFMPFYPSAGAGGHCIPKDPTFLLESSKKLGIKFTTIENAITANQYVPKYITNTIDNLITSAKLTKSVIVCGLAYKSDIEDMRDSPGFKLIKEFLEKKFDVYAYDPFFKKELLEKYLIENKITNKNFEILPNLSDDHLNGKSCLCLVQHHSKTKFRINEIISNSKMPLIYDCQNKLPLSKSKTKIISFGNKTI